MFLTVQSSHRVNFYNAYERFEAWIAARPNIHYGSCLYAQELIHEMIFAQKMLALLGEYSDRELIKVLEQLLNDLPPDYDPPPGGSFLY